MSSTRDVIAPPVFAENATTSIPEVPLAGVAYRDETTGPASAPRGWPFQEIVNSAHWNQLVYQWSKLLSIIDAKGVLGWTDKRVYSEPAIVFGSDGALYMWASPSGPGVGGGPKDPTSSPAFWIKMPKGLASQAEAESGSNADKAMTSLSVIQLLQATAARATTTKYGALRKATPAEIAAGSAVDAAVTPDLLGDVATRKVQTSQSDITAGSILLSGAYGWGFAIGVTAPTNLNTLDQPGNYSVVGTSPNLPVVSDSTVLVFGHKNRPSQIVVPENGTGPYFRGATNWGPTHTWGPWINLNAQSITGNAATATKLQTARRINGVLFDGTADITLPSDSSGFSGLFSGTGYRKLPDGTIFQWGVASVPTDANMAHDTVVNLPTTYPNANLFAMASWRQPPWAAALGQCGAIPLNNSSIMVRSSGGIVGPFGVNYYSLGH